MNIQKVTCIGAGLIGQGWAALFSSKGLEVVFQDVSETVLEKSMRGVESNLMFLEANHFLEPGGAKAAWTCRSRSAPCCPDSLRRSASR